MGQFDNSNPIQVECLRFCFTQLLQREFDQAVDIWNNHSIRRQRNAECPSGKPNMLYHTPYAFGSTDRIKPLLVDDEEIDAVEAEYCESYPRFGCRPEFTDLIREIIGEDIENFEMPTRAEEALALYSNILEIIDVIEEG